MDLEKWVLTETEKVMDEVLRLLDSEGVAGLIVLSCIEENKGILRLIKSYGDYLVGIHSPLPIEDEASQVVATLGLRSSDAGFDLYTIASELIVSNCSYILNFVGECLLLVDRLPPGTPEDIKITFKMDEEGQVVINSD